MIAVCSPCVRRVFAKYGSFDMFGVFGAFDIFGEFDLLSVFQRAHRCWRVFVVCPPCARHVCQ